MLRSRRGEGGSPPALIVLSELQIVPLPVHPNRDSADAIPGIQVGPEGPECSVIRRHGTPGEAYGCPQELATLVEQRLLNDPVSAARQRLRMVRSMALAVLRFNASSNFVGCSRGRARRNSTRT